MGGKRAHSRRSITLPGDEALTDCGVLGWVTNAAQELRAGQAASVPELDDLLLDAKLTAPRLHPGTVSRAGVIETARASECPVVGVTAPAGTASRPCSPSGPTQRTVPWLGVPRWVRR